MPTIQVRGPIRRVGNSLALLIPAREARRARLRPGQTVDATIKPEQDPILGLLADLNLGPYEPRSKVFGPDRD